MKMRLPFKIAAIVAVIAIAAFFARKILFQYTAKNVSCVTTTGALVCSLAGGHVTNGTISAYEVHDGCFGDAGDDYKPCSNDGDCRGYCLVTPTGNKCSGNTKMIPVCKEGWHETTVGL